MLNQRNNYIIAVSFIILIIGAVSIHFYFQSTSPPDRFEVQDFNYNHSAANNSSLDLDIELVNERLTEESSAVIKMSLSGWDNKFMTQSGIYPPFSVPRAVNQDSPYSIYLWSDDYKNNSRVHPGSYGIPQPAIVEYWETDSITREYELTTRKLVYNQSFGSGKPPSKEELKLKEGRYVIENSIGYAFNHDFNSNYEWLNYRIEFEVEKLKN